jgi:post-segregation antitoxin (ccd killing protein)
MSSYTTVSVRLPVDLREKMRKLGIEPSAVLRKALEDEVKKREAEKLNARISELGSVLDRFSTEEITTSIRQDRDLR